MRRVNRHKVKTEKPETSTSVASGKEEHDLAYYIHDRVELMHQVFSCLKYRELKAMAPECVRHISIDDLQELCTEELLGISSKRLCAIMDGAEPPSDTDSSSSPSPDNLETISLDSISSDEEILSQGSSKKTKKHKHRRRSPKSKSKCKKSKSATAKPVEEEERSRASRAGLTVLELLELQARARAIRAQLQQDQHSKQMSESVAPESSHHSSDGEVEIKEEPAEVVEISSDEEKPDIEKLRAENPAPQETQPSKPSEPTAVTKRINDLIITVPQAKPTRKIKLNRNKAPIPVSTTEKSKNDTSTATITSELGNNDVDKGKKDKVKKKKKDKKKKVEKDGSDHDEITLQLSDTEKMDLLEDLDRKSFDNVTSMDSDSSSDTGSESSEVDKKEVAEKSTVLSNTDNKEDSNKTKQDSNKYKESSCENEKEVGKDIDLNKNKNPPASLVKTTVRKPEKSPENIIKANTENNFKESDNVVQETSNTKTPEEENVDSENCEVAEHTVVATENVNIKITAGTEDRKVTLDTNQIRLDTENSETIDSANENLIETTKTSDIPIQEPEHDAAIDSKETTDKESGDANENTEKVKESDKKLSEGELSDKDSSEIEAVDLKPEILCISDDETEKSPKKKKKKKEKKSKKAKKSKNKDFRESADQNFYKDSETEPQTQHVMNTPITEDQADIIKIENETIYDKQCTANIKELTPDESVVITIHKETVRDTAHDINALTKISKVKAVGNEPIEVDDDFELEKIDLDEVYEILELSDDSSCYEVEGAVISKEPTAEEIEALSAKIDEIHRVDVVTGQEIREYESEIAEVENISWKDRYLDSAKVKKVLTTANIFNALRKKNIELKKKIEESKKEIDAIKEIEKELEVEKEVEVEKEANIVEGTIEHYNMLQGSTKYVDPVSEVSEEKGVTREMKKDAKTLLKMYKRLLKYNNMETKKDSKKKKKNKKAKKETDSVENKVTA